MGVGYAGMQKFGSYMNMSIVSEKAFQKHIDLICEASSTMMEKILEKARCSTKKLYLDLGMAETNNESITEPINNTVTYDGSWLTRGHKSKHGLAAVIDVMSGLVIDYNVMSKYCHKCVKAEKEFGVETAGFSEWYRDHEPTCPINHSESSGAMEKSAMELLWKRSESYGMRYTKVISDGDANAFNHLIKLEVYGSDIEIEKGECVNHVHKRYGSSYCDMKTCKRFFIPY